VKIGVNQTVITPAAGVDLAGFGRPGRKALGVHDDIYVVSMVINDASERVLIICADLIGFGTELAISLKNEISCKYGFSDKQILLSASHTHSGPQTTFNMLNVGEINEEYISVLKEKVMNSIKCAIENMTEAEIYCGLTKCNLGVNRRRLANGIIEFAPNEDGVTDDDVTVLKVVEGSGIKAVIFNYTCHPSMIDTDYVSADYPGRARTTIQQAFGKEVVVLFMQGFCGNIRARTVENNEFRAGTWEDVDDYGNTLGSKVVDVCKDTMKELKGGITSKIANISLPLKALPERQFLKKCIENGTAPEVTWANKMLQHYNSLKVELPFTAQIISIGDDFHIVALSGEVCVEYADYIKRNNNNVFITAGYCNGAPGYIPTSLMLRQGGYEPDGSTIYYGMPAQFDELVEDVVKASIDNILR